MRDILKRTFLFLFIFPIPFVQAQFGGEESFQAITFSDNSYIGSIQMGDLGYRNQQIAAISQALNNGLIKTNISGNWNLHDLGINDSRASISGGDMGGGTGRWTSEYFSNFDGGDMGGGTGHSAIIAQIYQRNQIPVIEHEIAKIEAEETSYYSVDLALEYLNLWQQQQQKSNQQEITIPSQSEDWRDIELFNGQIIERENLHPAVEEAIRINSSGLVLPAEAIRNIQFEDGSFVDQIDIQSIYGQ